VKLHPSPPISLDTVLATISNLIMKN